MPVPTTVREPEDTGEDVLDDPDDDPAHGLGTLAHHLVNAGVFVGQKERYIFAPELSTFRFAPQDGNPVVDVIDEQAVVVGPARKKIPE